MGRELMMGGLQRGDDDAPEIQLPLENRPAIFMVGSANVGKRTLLSRLISVDFEDVSDFTSGLSCYGWTIDTKYYTADLSIWMAHLDDRFSAGALPVSKHLAALVMVFDMSNPSSLAALQDSVSSIDLTKFEVLLCIGNKADLLPGHFAHAEYKRSLQKHGESSSDPHPEFWDYGILETEGSSLLGDEEQPCEIRKSCLEWCSQHNIEYIEACAANATFDKCLSIDGDLQGVERLYGALSAHMWPGMVMKSGNKMPDIHPREKEEFSDEESDYELEYELLSRGSAEPWDDGGDESWVALNEHTPGDQSVNNGDALEDGLVTTRKAFEDQSVNNEKASEEHLGNNGNGLVKDQHQTGDLTCVQASSTSTVLVQEESASLVTKSTESDEDMKLGYEDLEQLMCEIGSMRDNLRLMPDFQRKEMASKLAMKMAAMFMDSSEEEDHPI